MLIILYIKIKQKYKSQWKHAHYHHVFLPKVPNSAILTSGTKLAAKTYWMNKGKDSETTFSKVAKLHEK